MGIWDSDSLWLKANTFIDKAIAVGQAHPDFGLWAALALELLARSALAKIHPALNADPQDDKNLLYAFGFPVVGQPRSLPAHSVYLRLEKILPDFRKPQRELCDYMALRRNAEIHTGEVAFPPADTSKWQPQFYGVCRVLCGAVGKSLDQFLGADLASAADKMIDAFAKGQEKAVKDKIAAHAKVFAAKPPEERTKLADIADQQTKMLRIGSVRRTCPACGSFGVLRGERIKELEPKYEDGQLVVDVEYLATEFQCLACGLHLATIDEIGIAGLELVFTVTTSTDLHERFQPEYEDDYQNM
jgi:predicted RNA-binding Zn-ribbon protein involved in translation (DUF1610 family)